MSRYAAQILEAGPLALLQDKGRFGAQHLGISVSGVADRHAAGWANRLLSNPDSAPLVEICLGKFRLRFADVCHFAVTGADMHWKLNDRPLNSWCTYRASAGDVLSAAYATSGLRGYLAMRGGIVAPMICGSCATSIGDGLGGLHGDGVRLQAGDRLQVSTVDADWVPDRWVPPKFRRTYKGPIELRVVPSNQFAQFSAQSRHQFFDSSFEVAAESDRMGVRLKGTSLPDAPGSMISEAVGAGAIQVPANGLPIVLMPDCQTIGGYPKLGHVYRADLDRLAQARPGTSVQFSLGDRAEAQREWLFQTQFFSAQECG